jgi:ADP-heptose:LPS heptosyltransferase
MAQRFLLIRLSSMGDIVLTTPLLRALRQSYPQAEIHYLTRPSYASLLQHNPHLTALHLWPPTPDILRSYWDGVIDLQKNLRTWRLRLRLRYKRWTTFPEKKTYASGSPYA